MANNVNVMINPTFLPYLNDDRKYQVFYKAEQDQAKADSFVKNW